jgi:glutamate synthase (NADPH/NADH) small chain
MGDPKGFMTHGRELPARRPVPVRLRDWKEVYEPFSDEKLRVQASRCMDCGIPFCNNGCPLGNLIPDWNDLVYRDHWHDAIDRLHATNNFPEFTGRLCPAPCEAACVLGINSDPVTIKQVEVDMRPRSSSRGPGTTSSCSSEPIASAGCSATASQSSRWRSGSSIVAWRRWRPRAPSSA